MDTTLFLKVVAKPAKFAAWLFPAHSFDTLILHMAQAIDDSEFIKTLFPTAYKSMYKGSDEPNVEEVPNEKVDE